MIKLVAVDLETGNIKTCQDQAELLSEIAQGYPKVKALSDYISPGCKDCYGRGHLGHDKKSNQPVPCKCVRKAFFKDQDRYKQSDHYKKKQEEERLKNMNKEATREVVHDRRD